MKVLPFKIPKTVESTFIYQEDKTPSFYNKFHAHEEIQVSLILSGTGELFVGDTIISYKKDDIYILGSNLPHLFQSDSESNLSYMKSIFFTIESLGYVGKDLLRDKKNQSFFEDTKRGISVNSQQNEIRKRITEISSSNKLAATISFFQFLELLINADKEFITQQLSAKNYSETEGKRMGDILNFTFNEYNRSISLNEVAEVANMSKNAFCRYFKLKTNKTFFEFLIELRIENACKLLCKNNFLTISEIAENCGFTSVSHFNRKFKRYKNTTPKNYRKQQFSGTK